MKIQNNPSIVKRIVYLIFQSKMSSSSSSSSKPKKQRRDVSHLLDDIKVKKEEEEDEKINVKKEDGLESLGFDYQPRKDVMASALMPYMRAVSHRGDVDNQYVATVSLLEYKALFRFVAAVVKSMQPQFVLTDVIDVFRLRYFDVQRLQGRGGGGGELEHVMHRFTDKINFAVQRMLAKVRMLKPLRDVKLLELLMNHNASDSFALLVAALWNDTRIDAGDTVQSDKSIAKADTDDRAVFSVFEKMTASDLPLRADIEFEATEYYVVDNMGPVHAFTDADLFETFEYPNNFMLRLVLQAVQMHNPDELRRVLNTARVKVGGDKEDASDKHMLDNVFEAQNALGFTQARLLIVSSTGCSQNDVLSWMSRSADNCATFAHLVALCIAGRAFSGGRLNRGFKSVDRHNLKTQCLVIEICHSFKAQGL